MRASDARPGRAWLARARPQQQRAAKTRVARRRRKLYIGPLLIMTFIVIEALLATRIAGQATSQEPNWWVFGGILTVTDVLVAPFRNLQPEPIVKDTGVVEFSTLVALEAYLVGFLALIFLIQLVHIGAWFFRGGRRSSKPALALMESQPAAIGLEQESSQQAA